MTDEEIIEEMARVIALKACGLDEISNYRLRADSYAPTALFGESARAAFAIARARIREQCAEEVENAAEVRRLLQDNHARQFGSHSVAASQEGYAALALEEFSFALRKPKANPND